MSEGKFATSVSCIDGRIQFPLASWIKKMHSIDFVDVISEPGVDKKIVENIDLESIKNWKANTEHKQAQKLGHEKWYASFMIRISKVERDYGI